MTDNHQEPSFADLLEEHSPQPAHYEPGQKVLAPILSIGPEWTFLDLPGKNEGYFASSEITDAHGNRTVNQGDTIAVYFLTVDKTGLRFTTRLGAGAEALAHLEEAHAAGIPLEGTVQREIKGGYEIKIAGSTRAFCPYSQAGLQRVDADTFIGQTLPFQIIEYKEEGRNIIVSRRILLEEEQRRKIAALRETLAVGQVVPATVTSIRDFGAFARLAAGIEGLIPIREIGWGRIEDIHDKLAVGQEIEVEILSLDWDKEKFSFSLKNTEPDPWQTVPDRFPVGSTHRGEVSRLTTFGAFVTLADGIDGLIHISALVPGRRISHPKEAVSVGQALEVKVEKVDLEQRRIGLSPVEVLCPQLMTAKKSGPLPEVDTSAEDYRRYQEQAKPARTGSMGTLGDLLRKKLS